MSGWTGFAPVVARLAAVAAMLGLASLVLLRCFRAGRKAAGQHELGRAARPCRQGERELAAQVESAKSRPHSRDILAQRLKALSREVAALRFNLDEGAARDLVEARGFPPQAGAADFLLVDYLSRKASVDSDFLPKALAALSALKESAGLDTEKTGQANIEDSKESSQWIPTK